jgi:enoyl-CoA hydratase
VRTDGFAVGIGESLRVNEKLTDASAVQGVVAGTRVVTDVRGAPQLRPTAASSSRYKALMVDLVKMETRGPVAIVTLNRWEQARNAVDRETAAALASTFRAFDSDDGLSVAVLNGAGGTFCAGADLKTVAERDRALRLADHGDGPMGFSRLVLSKPVIAAVEGHAVAGGLELAIWCDLRVAGRSAVFGVFCRRWGVPLMDGGTVRLARLGHSRALDMILTGRGVRAEEAFAMGLANRVVDDGDALRSAIELAENIARFPQNCLRSDRLASYEQWSLSLPEAIRNEFYRGMEVLRSGETATGMTRFVGGAGRHGSFE